MNDCVVQELFKRNFELENKRNDNRKRIKEGRDNADAHAIEIVRLRRNGAEPEEIKRIFETCGVAVSQKRLTALTIPTWLKVYSVFLEALVVISFFSIPVVFALVGLTTLWAVVPLAIFLFVNALFFYGNAFETSIALGEDAKESRSADGL